MNPTETKCPTCGSKCLIHHGDEGTSEYMPKTTEVKTAADWLKENNVVNTDLPSDEHGYLYTPEIYAALVGYAEHYSSHQSILIALLLEEISKLSLFTDEKGMITQGFITQEAILKLMKLLKDNI